VVPNFYCFCGIMIRRVGGDRLVSLNGIMQARTMLSGGVQRNHKVSQEFHIIR